MSCWWICNLDSEDHAKTEAKMICRSLAALRTELISSRLATSQKLRLEHDKRLENNAAAVDRIHENRDLWFQAGGCDPDLLKKPSEQLLEHAQNVVSTLDKMLQAHGPQNGLDSFVEGLTQAVKKIKLCDWAAIKKDRFSLTPSGLYDAMVQAAEGLITGWGRDFQRRQTRMQKPLEQDEEALMEADNATPFVDCRRKDKYGLNIDQEFRKHENGGKRFQKWEEALKSTNEVLIDEMLTLLELHYEDIAKKKSKNIYGSVAYAHRKTLNQKLVLPQRVKDIMRSSALPDLQIRGHQFFDIGPRLRIIGPLALWPAGPARRADPRPSVL